MKKLTSDNHVTRSVFVENKVLANEYDTCKKRGPIATVIPGKTRVEGWILIDFPKEVIEKGFGEVILDKMKGPMQKEQRKRKTLIKRQW